MATLTTNWQVINDKALSGVTGAYLQTIARYTSQSVDGNYSEVEVQLRIRNVKYTAFHCYTHSCSFNGGTFDASDWKGSYYHGWESETTTTILSQSKRIYHNDNGDAGFNLWGSFDCSAGVSGNSYVENSVYCGLPHINRLSVFSIDKPNFNIGDIINVSVTKYVSGYTNNLYMVIGGNEVLIESNIGSSTQIDTGLLANTLYQQIPNAKSYSNVFKLYTYNNGSSLGSKTINYTANVVDSNPSFNVAYEDTNSTTTGITQDNQKIIQNKSTLRVKITGASVTHYAGGLSSASVTIGSQVTTISLSGQTGVSANIDVGTLNLSQNTTARVRVTDSRGNYLDKTITLTILPYATPSAEIYLQRKLNYYTQTDIKVDTTYSSLDGNNTMAITYRYKKTFDSTWGAFDTLTDGVMTTFSVDNTYAWDVQVVLQDALETRTINRTLPAGQPPLYVDVYKNSVGVNCFPTNAGSLEISGKTIFDLVYPIGSIYISTSSTNPGTYFTGTTWTAFGAGRTLVGVDSTDSDFNTAEATGGSKYMQQHSHTIDSASLTGSAGNYLMDDYNPYIAASGIFSIGSRGGTYDRSWAGSTGSNAFRTLNVNASHSHSMQNAGTGNSGNLQPYINVYFWKRTS